MSNRAVAVSSSVYLVSGNEYAYFDGSTTTYWDLTTVTAGFPNVLGVLQSQPWWGSPVTANLFAAAVAGNLGYPNAVQVYFYVNNFSPYFAWVGDYVSDSNFSLSWMRTGGVGLLPYAGVQADVGLGGTYNTYATATLHSASVPEIDGKLIPQVGLLLAGLFIILGRRKENTEPLLVA